MINQYYSTSDLALAAAITLWYPLESTEKIQNSNKFKFIFKQDKQVDQLIESYWRGSLKVNPQSYFQALKILKSRLYENY